MKEKFYNRGWFMWLMLIFIAPVGMILMWKNKRFPKAVRAILTVVFCIVTIFQGFIYFAPKNNTNNVSANSNITNSANVAEVSTNSTNSNNVATNNANSNTTNNTAALSQNSSSNTTTVQQNSAPTPSTPQPEKKQESASTPTPAPIPKQPATPTPAQAPTPEPPKNVSVSASVSDPTPHTNERVTVNVKGPVGGTITAIAHYKSKDTTQNGTISSNGNGAVVFDISRAAKGYAVTIDVDVNSNGQSGHAQTSFTPR